MSANEFSLERVDSLANIASATPAANEKDKKRRNRPKPEGRRLNEPDTPSRQATDDSDTGAEGHIIDFEA
jgi:hypothetical protein